MWCCCSVSKVLSWQQGNNDFQPSRCFRSLCKKAKICVWPMSNEGFKRRRHDLWNRFCHSLLKKTTYTVQMFQSRTCSAAWIRCVRNGFKQAKTESFKCKYQISWTKKSMFYRCESKTNIFVPSCSFEICLKPCFQRLCQRLWRKRLRTGGQEVSERELSGWKVLKKVTGLVLSFSSFYTQDQIWMTRTI